MIPTIEAIAATKVRYITQRAREFQARGRTAEDFVTAASKANVKYAAEQFHGCECGECEERLVVALTAATLDITNKVFGTNLVLAKMVPGNGGLIPEVIFGGGSPLSVRHPLPPQPAIES